ncbi:enoyl-CoA hydratase [Sphingobium lactosutens]|uniref:enoyl-CoA hydratase-related protein n=1 Tax=Sphingobium lactosutens TaxID=522773 RepID=UPI0015C0B87B|nr:enoyl-CoA hydratase-related protein [Sphingobium lactosutens]NWK98270.1 enoyl-CoA hydratase [Sphingobium lactosutens]
MNFDHYEMLSFSRDGRVLTITMNRPELLNAVNHALHEEMARVFFDAADDTESDVIVLTGAGKAFSAGGDFDWLEKQAKGDRVPFVHEAKSMRRIVMGLLDCAKPVIAKVNGDAMGFGASLALLSDIIIAADHARFADPHVKLGLVAGDGGALIWPQLIGFAKAKHYLLTGEPIGAVEAERCNLINFAVPAEELDAFVDKYTAKLARGAQTAIRYTKSITNIPLRQLFSSVFEAGVAYEGLATYTTDFGEAVHSVLEKRRPEFTGK